MHFTLPTDRRGAIALIAVIMVASLTVIYGLAVALMVLDERQTSQAWLYTTDSEFQSTACVSNAITMLRNNTSLAGNVNLNISNVNCTSIISGSGNYRTVTSTATVTDSFGRSVVDKVYVNVNIDTNPFTIESYKDVLD